MIQRRYPQTILATACVPWTKSNTFDEDAFRLNVRNHIHNGVKHIYLFGTAGEGYAVNDSQFFHIVKTFADEMNDDSLKPMVGLISLSFTTMLERLQVAYSLGIRDFQFALPAWGSLTDNELILFIHQLCDPYPDCRFFHYNQIRSKRLLTIKDYEQIASEVPNIVGAKFSTNSIANILDMAISDCPLRFFLTEEGFGFGSLISDFGLLLSIASTNMSQAWEYFSSSKNGDYKKLTTMQQQLYSMTNRLLEIVGTDKIDAAYDKIYCKIQQPSFPLRLLPPYLCASDAACDEYAAFLNQHYPQWII